MGRLTVMMHSTAVFIRFSACLLAFSAAILSLGCAVGPDYVRPEIAAPEEWHTKLEGGLTAREPSRQTLANWWKTLNDPILATLIDQAIGENLDLKLARARLLEARANRYISRAALYPTVDASGSFTRSRSSEERGSGSKVDLYTAGFDSSWEIDIFGGVRRSIEAATADLQASREDLGDVLVSLLAEVALNYVEARTYQARLAVAEDNLKAQEEIYQLASWNYEAGLSTELAMQQAKYNLEATRAQIPTLRIGLEANKNRLAVLLGQRPGAISPALESPGPIAVPPLEIAVGVPAEMLRRRPDVRRAERQLAAQTARVGVATAELYPKFSLFGSLGVQALSAGNLLSSGSRAYSFGPSMLFPVFNAGAIRSNIKVQSARQEQALILYESTVLNAEEEVENAIFAYLEEQLRLQSLKASAEAARKAVELAEDHYQAGLSDFTSLLDAQRSLLSFQDQLALSRGTVTSDLIRLYKGLGGGWEPMAPLPVEGVSQVD